MKIITVLVLVIAFLVACGDDKNNDVVLPSGCSSSGVFALQIVQSDLACVSTNAFTDVSAAVGAPDANTTGPGKTQYQGFVSLGINGSITAFMGSCIQDLPGPDLRVYQSVSREGVEVQVGQSADGPFVSLGVQDCNDPPPFFHGFCEFDLAGSGMTNARVVKVIDRETITFPGAACDNTGLSPGADIDAIEVVHPVQ